MQINELIKAARGGQSEFHVVESGVTIEVVRDGDNLTYKPGFPVGCPAMAEATFSQAYAYKVFALGKAPEPVAQPAGPDADADDSTAD